MCCFESDSFDFFFRNEGKGEMPKSKKRALLQKTISQLTKRFQYSISPNLILKKTEFIEKPNESISYEIVKGRLTISISSWLIDCSSRLPVPLDLFMLVIWFTWVSQREEPQSKALLQENPRDISLSTTGYNRITSFK